MSLTATILALRTVAGLARVEPGEGEVTLAATELTTVETHWSETGIRVRPWVPSKRVATLAPWRGGGILRIAPTDRPWSIWVFRGDDGSLAGHYINLELTHRRCGDETNTRDLILDLWLEPSGALWLKDADELEAAVVARRYGAAQADEIRAVAEWARVDLVEGRAWPLDEEWTTWHPPASWDVPSLPDTPLVAEARRTTLPR